MPWLIEVAALVSAALGDVKDFSFLFALLVVNGLVAFIEEHKAGNAIDALKASLAPKARPARRPVVGRRRASSCPTTRS